MSKSFGLTLTGVVLSSIVIACLWFKRDMSDSSSSPTIYEVADKVDVSVIGTRFHWKFVYPGPDGVLKTSDDIVSDRLLYLPPETSVRFHITSEDYVYILGIPLNETGSDNVQINGPKIREIAVPDLTHYIEHDFVKAGAFDLMVDPLCGFQSLHDPRMGQIIVSDERDYSTFFPPAQSNNGPL